MPISVSQTCFQIGIWFNTQHSSNELEVKCTTFFLVLGFFFIYTKPIHSTWNEFYRVLYPWMFDCMRNLFFLLKHRIRFAIFFAHTFINANSLFYRLVVKLYTKHTNADSIHSVVGMWLYKAHTDWISVCMYGADVRLYRCSYIEKKRQ